MRWQKDPVHDGWIDLRLDEDDDEGYSTACSYIKQKNFVVEDGGRRLKYTSVWRVLKKGSDDLIYPLSEYTEEELRRNLELEYLLLRGER